MIHIPITSAQPPLLGRRGRLHRELRLWLSRQALSRGREHFAVRYREYGWDEIWRLLAEGGFERVETRVFPVRSNGYHHAFWVATRP